jgi:hypothetical protein
VFSTEDHGASLFAPIGGLSLEAYVGVCRALVRTAAGSARRLDEVLAARGLSEEEWTAVSTAWSERIRVSAAVHSEFGRLYATPEEERPAGTGP